MLGRGCSLYFLLFKKGSNCSKWRKDRDPICVLEIGVEISLCYEFVFVRLSGVT